MRPGSEEPRRTGYRDEPESLLPAHGGYRNLKTFKLAQLIYDVTVRFCELYVDPRSRTHDQMVQAARSGSRNIAEGSQDSGTSKKIELKLTNVARGSLEELRLDYEDFLRHRGLAIWPPDSPALRRFKARRCARLEDVQAWVAAERAMARTDRDEHERRSVSVCEGPCRSVSSAELAANGALSLLNLCCFLLDRQLESQATAFERDGGFTERLHRIRTRARSGSTKP